MKKHKFLIEVNEKGDAHIEMEGNLDVFANTFADALLREPQIYGVITKAMTIMFEHQYNEQLNIQKNKNNLKPNVNGEKRK